MGASAAPYCQCGAVPNHTLPAAATVPVHLSCKAWQRAQSSIWARPLGQLLYKTTTALCWCSLHFTRAAAVHHTQHHAQSLLTHLWPLPLPTGACSAAQGCPAAPAALLAAGGAPPPPPAGIPRHGDVNHWSELHPAVTWTEADTALACFHTVLRGTEAQCPEATASCTFLRGTGPPGSQSRLCLDCLPPGPRLPTSAAIQAPAACAGCGN